MKRLMVVALVVAACGSSTPSARPATFAPTVEATPTAAAIASSELHTPPAASSASATPAADAITGYGALEADWAAIRVPDTRFEPGCCYNPTLGLGPDGLHSAKYYAVLVQDGRIGFFEERLAVQTSIAEAKDAALAEFPPDGEIIWFEALDTCALAELQSPTLAKVIGRHGRALVAFDSDVSGGGAPFDPSNVARLEFFPDDSDQPDPDVGC